jgi:hypothetical protein
VSDEPVPDDARTAMALGGNMDAHARTFRLGSGLVLAGMMVFSVAGTSLAADDTLAAPAPLEAENTCPDGIDDWTKVDGTADDDATTYALRFSGTQRGTATENDPQKGLVSVSLDSGWTVDLCVKGGKTVVFAYGVVSGDHSSVQVLAGSGAPADVGHFSYRLTPPRVADQWCSPGFWKNNHGAWAPTGFSPSSIDGATGKSFGTILSNPKTFARTGDFERIADVLSTAHAGVDFGGDRVADSCPLPADKASK